MKEKSTDTPPEVTPEVKPEVAPEAKVKSVIGYMVKVNGSSPVKSVQSAGVIFTGEGSAIVADHPSLAELQANPWLDVTEVTE
jgi:hypothetical protein